MTVQVPWKTFREKWERNKGETRGQMSQAVDTGRNTAKGMKKGTWKIYMGEIFAGECLLSATRLSVLFQGRFIATS